MKIQFNCGLNQLYLMHLKPLRMNPMPEQRGNFGHNMVRSQHPKVSRRHP